MVPSADPRLNGWSLHHIGVATDNAEAAALQWESVGYERVTDLLHDPVQRVRVLFLGNGVPGNPLIELVEPAAADAPVHRFVQNTPRFYHLCFEVPEIKEALNAIRQAGWLIIQEPTPATAFDGRPIAWVFSRARDLIELVEAEPST